MKKEMIREADLDRDAEQLIGLIRVYLNPDFNRSAYDWLYRSNPHGLARTWVLCLPETSELIGMASAFPRRMVQEGNSTTGWVLGDFCVKETHRSLGFALQLQRAIIEEVDRGRVAFFYDFPSASMLAVYRRIGITAAYSMTRLALPLRLDQMIKGVTGDGSIARVVAAACNPILSLYHRRGRMSRGLTIRFQEGLCGQEFTELFAAVSPNQGLTVERSASYLNWRYLSHPLRKHSMLVAHEGERLVGYCAVHVMDQEAVLADLFGEDDKSIVETLITTLVQHLEKQGVCTLSVPILDGHPKRDLLLGLGFYEREESPVLFYGTETSSPTWRPSGLPWSLMAGDRDS